MNERGHFFSEGNYDILGAPLSDGSDAHLDGFAAMGKRQGGHHRLFVDSGMAARGGGARKSRIHDDDP